MHKRTEVAATKPHTRGRQPASCRLVHSAALDPATEWQTSHSIACHPSREAVLLDAPANRSRTVRGIGLANIEHSREFHMALLLGTEDFLRTALDPSLPPGYLTRSHLPDFGEHDREVRLGRRSVGKTAGTIRVSVRRRTLLKTTTKALVGWITVATALSTTTAVAGPLGGGSTVWLAAATLGQAASAGAPEDKNAKVADLLHRARQAIEENNLTAAESLISQAEALDVQYGPFYFGDTPKKARRDLERKRACCGRAGQTKPSFLALRTEQERACPQHGPVCWPID